MRALPAAAAIALLTPAGPASAAGAAMLPGDIAPQYRQAVRAHDVTLAAHLRTETRLIAEADPRYAALASTVAKTKDRYRPWPLASEVEQLAPPASTIE